MNRLEKYLYDALGIVVAIKRLPDGRLKNLPLYIRSMYNFKTTQLFYRNILLLEPKEKEYLTAEQYRKHIQIVVNVFDEPAVLVLGLIEAYNRKRLIEKKIAFIIPGKQMFLPQLLIDLKEFRYTSQKKKEKIQPATQCLLIFHLLKENVEEFNFKMIAAKLNYTPMTITRVVNELVENKLCRIEGRKEKKIVFEMERKAIWEMALPYLQNPVKKKIYLDEKIDTNLVYKTGYSALSFYTNMDSDAIECYAISNTNYLNLKNHKRINITNNTEGHICLEIWKYAPVILAENGIVDPLSLYLTLRDIADERVEMELDRMVARLW